jgi:putative flippase GtrA
LIGISFSYSQNKRFHFRKKKHKTKLVTTLGSVFAWFAFVLCLVFCVPYVASFSGLFINDCPSLFSNVYLIDINGKYQLLIMLLISMSKYIRYRCVLTNTHALRIIQENNISLRVFSNFKR